MSSRIKRKQKCIKLLTIQFNFFIASLYKIRKLKMQRKLVKADRKCINDYLIISETDYNNNTEDIHNSLKNLNSRIGGVGTDLVDDCSDYIDFQIFVKEESDKQLHDYESLEKEIKDKEDNYVRGANTIRRIHILQSQAKNHFVTAEVAMRQKK